MLAYSIMMLYYEGLPEGVGRLVDEGLLVLDNIVVPNGGEDPDLVECVLLFLVGEIVEFDLFEGVFVVVEDPAHFVDAAVGPFSEFGNDLEFLD